MCEFFGCEPDSPFLFQTGDYIYLIVSKKGMTEVPALNDTFRIGPYLFKCILVRENHICGLFHAPTL